MRLRRRAYVLRRLPTVAGRFAHERKWFVRTVAPVRFLQPTRGGWMRMMQVLHGCTRVCSGAEVDGVAHFSSSMAAECSLAIPL